MTTVFNYSTNKDREEAEILLAIELSKEGVPLMCDEPPTSRGDNQEEKLRMEQDVNMAGSRMNLSDSQESLAEAQVEKEEEELKAAIAMSLASMSSQ